MTQETSRIAARRAVHRYLKAVIAVGVLGALVTTSAWLRLEAVHAAGLTTATSPPNVAPASGPDTASYAPIVERVSPAIVTIRVETRADEPAALTPLSEPPSRDFFGRDWDGPTRPRAPRQQGLGSGVVVRQDGYILTNHHVVENASQIHVELFDKRVLPAVVVGDDAPSDLAVLRIETSGLTPIALADSDRARIGDIVLAFGNPLGLGQTVTAGIISAKGRTTGSGEGAFEDFLQTDAPINQGNSGGALVNLHGELLGINSQIVSPSGGNIGLGFAIPSNMARHVVDQLIADGHVRRAKLGVTVQPVTADIAASLGLPDVRGALVSNVQADSPGARAGLRPGDVIQDVQGRTVRDGNELRNQVASLEPGTTVALKVLRDGHPQVLSARLEELPTGRGPASPAANDRRGTSALGMSVVPVTPDIAAELSLPRSTKGLVVTAVDPDGEAASSGVQEHDVIETMNGQPTGSVADLRAAIAHATDKPALVLINRDGTNLYLTLRVAHS